MSRGFETSVRGRYDLLVLNIDGGLGRYDPPGSFTLWQSVGQCFARIPIYFYTLQVNLLGNLVVRVHLENRIQLLFHLWNRT